MRAVAALWRRTDAVLVDAAGSDFHEAGVLRLDSTRAKRELGWGPVWNFSTTIEQTMLWYESWLRGGDMAAVTREQIDVYERAAAAMAV